MNLQKCEHGHFYDADKSPVCPHCQRLEDDRPTQGKPISETIPVTPVDVVPNPQPKPAAKAEPFAVSDDAVTVSIFQRKTEFGAAEAIQPVVGWLVCIKGEEFGKSYTLRNGKNFIGRGADMDVVISGDPSISRSRHACLIYEPHARVFYAQPGDSHELFYLNDRVVLNNEVLKSHDVLLLGNTELLFVPLCGKEFGWDSVSGS